MLFKLIGSTRAVELAGMMIGRSDKSAWKSKLNRRNQGKYQHNNSTFLPTWKVFLKVIK